MLLLFCLYLMCFVVHVNQNVNCATLQDYLESVQVHFGGFFSGIRITSPLLRFASSVFRCVLFFLQILFNLTFSIVFIKTYLAFIAKT